MKKIMTTMALLAMVLFTASAQIKMKVTMNGPQEAITESGQTVKLDGTLILPYDAIKSIEYFRETVKGLHTVDLGLPSGTLWANFNYGATDSTKVGTQLAWADLSQVSDVWGTEWTAPTKVQIEELMNNEYCEWVQEYDPVTNRVIGYNVYGKNNASIFIPVTSGYKKADGASYSSGSYYWISDAPGTRTAYFLNFDDEGNKKLGSNDNTFLMAVRPVWTDGSTPTPQPVTPSVSLSLARASAPTQTGVTYRITLTGDYDKVTECGVYYSTSANLAASTNKVAGTRSGNTATVSLTGLSASTTYYLRAYAIVTGLSNEVYSSDVQFTTAGTEVKPDPTVVEDPNYPIADYVDLGLPSGTKWATWNMGAQSVNDLGKYFEWGMLSDTTTNNDNYYHTSLGVDTLIAGNPEYDIATAKWGEGWSMPTTAQFDELKALEWTYVSDPIAGWRISGNGNSIFIPLAGSRTNQKVSDKGESGWYWTGYSRSNYEAICKSISKSLSSHVFMRSLGCSIRPVYTRKINNEHNNQGDSTYMGDYINGAYVPKQAVDMGTSVKWARWNVGATDYTDPGSFYSWGEIDTKDDYTFDNYSEDFNGKSIQDPLDDNHDVVRKLWGGKWRMPKKNELDNLRQNAEVKWVREGDTYGMKLTKNGKTLFFPANGYFFSGSQQSPRRGCYWSKTPDEGRTFSWLMYFEEDGKGGVTVGLDYYNRAYGLLVRPVWDESLKDLK